VTDGQTDGRTDGIVIAYTRYSYAVARKKDSIGEWGEWFDSTEFPSVT